jgi:hypothetical protein
MKTEGRQPLLFPPPDPPPVNGSAVLDFGLTLKDGCKVSVHYERRWINFCAHIEFRGEGISGTGYRSFFPPGQCLTDEPDDEVIEAARILAEELREKRLGEIAKEKRPRRAARARGIL